MVVAFLYDNDVEQKKHNEAILRLSNYLRIPEEEVKKLYETALGRFKESAKIKDFLVILVTRHVKDTLVRNRTVSDRPGPVSPRPGNVHVE